MGRHLVNETTSTWEEEEEEEERRDRECVARLVFGSQWERPDKSIDEFKRRGEQERRRETRVVKRGIQGSEGRNVRDRSQRPFTRLA